VRVAVAHNYPAEALALTRADTSL